LLQLQDLLQNTQYSLLLLNDTVGVTYFSDANSTTYKEEALLWQVIKNNPKCFAESNEHAEKLILENPFNVFFASNMMASWQLKNVPCLIDATSNVLATVLKCICLSIYFYDSQ
jgi:hypothetical protein